MWKQIKHGLLNRPLVTVWKLLLLPTIIIITFIYALIIIIFNLGLTEAKEFLDNAF